MVTQGHKWLRLATLAMLYFIQGAPYGFQTACLPIILRSKGLSFSAIGAMKLLFLPWVCKPLYAPLITTTKTKRFWLSSSMLAMAATCIYGALFTGPDDLVAISGLMFALNLFSAAQDITTDSLALSILRPEELGVGNTVQVVAYKAGSVFAGGLLLYIEDLLGWATMFWSYSAMYGVCVLLLTKLSVDKPKKKEEDHPSPSLIGADVLSAMRKVFAVPNTVYMVCFVLFYKLCERAEQTFSLYMVDKEVPHATMAFWSTIMRTGSLLGSTYGGFLLSSSSTRSQARDVITKYSALRTLPIIGQLVVIDVWGFGPMEKDSDWDTFLMYSGFLCTSVTLFCAGVITTATFTLMMRISQKVPDDLQGVHYTTLATFEVLGKLVFASIAGTLIDLLGLEFMFVTFISLAVTCVPFAHLLPDLSGD